MKSLFCSLSALVALAVNLVDAHGYVSQAIISKVTAV